MARRVPVERWTAQGSSPGDDRIAEEAALEILVEYSFKQQRRTASWGFTLRTPGHDGELALGLLLAEGRLESAADVAGLHQSAPDRLVVSLVESAEYAPGQGRLATAACGFCGASGLPEVPALEDSGFRVTYSTLAALPAALEALQGEFRETGGVHAAALFSPSGDIVAIREDVGRHNAVDKLIGHAALAGAPRLSGCGLLLSGRAGFELLHKAAAAGIPLVAAIGAPTALALDAARAANITLAGFLRSERLTVYSGNWRVRLLPD